ncbi:MAG: DUF1440 domain-containing protein [Cyanobacteriota bacterium]
MQNTKNANVIADMVKGALAGAIGVWALDQVTWAMWNREDPEALDQERQARPGGLDPAHVMANRAAHALGMELTPKQPNAAGMVIHYSLGVVPGAIYGALRHEVDGLDIGRGALFGLGLGILQDQLVNSMIGTSGAPTEYPPEAHIRGLVGHVVYGLVMDMALEMLDRVALAE